MFMNDTNIALLKSKWHELLRQLGDTFGEEPDLQGIIFLIGVQELGQGVREFSNGGGKGIAGRDIQAHVTDNDAEALVFGLILQGLETLHQRQAGREEGRELLRKNGELPHGQLVTLRFLLE